MKDARLPPLTDLLVDFVNSRRLGSGAFDRLQERASAVSWLKKKSLLAQAESLSSREQGHLLELRETLRQVFVDHAKDDHEKLRAHSLRLLEQAARQSRIVFTGQGVDLRPEGKGGSQARGEIARAAFWVLAFGAWPQLKACLSDTCHLAFFDESKNRSRTWCSMSPCGNLMKARALRARRKPRQD